MTRAAITSSARSSATLTAPPVRRTVPPLLPIVLPLVLAAIVLAMVFARLFPASAIAPVAPVARFTDITAESGVRFVHQSGRQDSPTTLGGAVVVFDYDRDGRPDLFFVNGAVWPWEETGRTQEPTSVLYHNDGEGHFTDVSRTAGLDLIMQGMSGSAGDYDNDGFPDLFITGVGQNRLMHNQRDGTFMDVTATAGTGGDGHTWSTGAVWTDYDGDGKLDLVIANYARWPDEMELGMAFSIALMGRSYGAPTGFFNVLPTVYRNQGGGRFVLVPGAAGLRNIDAQTGRPVGKALAVTALDANGDGRLDLLFSYHTAENALFLNQGDGSFRSWTAGAGERHEGAAAGLASGDVLSRTQRIDDDESFAAIESAAKRMAHDPADSRLHLGGKLGTALLDYDLDGRWDLFSSQGIAEPDVNRFETGRNFAAPPQLLWNGGASRLVPLSLAGLENGNSNKSLVARGVAVLDLDGDGDDDVVLVQNNGPAVILRNDQREARPWLRVRLQATRSQPDAGGARVEVHTPARILVRTLTPAVGFMAQSEAVLTFGLGEDARVRNLVIHWPSGQRQELSAPTLNQTLTVREP